MDVGSPSRNYRAGGRQVFGMEMAWPPVFAAGWRGEAAIGEEVAEPRHVVDYCCGFVLAMPRWQRRMGV